MAEIKTLDSMSAQLVMAEAYEQAYGLFDHEQDSGRTPFASLLMHSKEVYAPMSRLYEIFRDFYTFKIGQDWNTDIQTFLSLPREFTDLMFEISKNRVLQEKPLVDKALQDMKNLQRGAK